MLLLFGLHLSFSIFPELPGSVVWCLTLICGNSQSLLFHILFVSLSSSGVLITSFVFVSSCVLCFLPLFSLSFSFILRWPQVQSLYPQAISSLLLSPTKAFFINSILFFNSSIFFFFGSFLRFPSMCMCVCVCVCVCACTHTHTLSHFSCV